MKRALPALLLLVAIGAWAKKPAPRTRPPPPAEEVLPEQEPPPPDEGFEAPVDPIADPPPDPNPDPTPTPDLADLTDEEAGAAAIGMLCCCSVFLIGLVGLIVWLVKRGSKAKSPVQANFPPPVSGAAPPQAHSPGGMQLSILALALEPQARGVVEQQLSQLGISSVPNTPDARGRLVREVARALLTVQPSWRQFGYGEKPVSVGATATPGSGLVVVTLLICCRRTLLGVSRLDDPFQVRNVLEDRMRVTDLELLGAELLWAPAAPDGRISEAEIGLRFPEMLPLTRPPN
ncbi:MAG: putative glycine rich rane protein [Myxococcaceae bacterium]|nr:putative glycine rich rane protein [Myxococcaceae bacterium]